MSEVDSEISDLEFISWNSKEKTFGTFSQGLNTAINQNNNINRELTEQFQNLKVLYSLKKNIQCTNTHNYTNQ